jgi:imidazolonepropionase-like amidohydrolase
MKSQHVGSVKIGVFAKAVATFVSATIAALLLFGVPAFGRQPQAPAPVALGSFVITNVRIFDGHRVIARGSVWVDGGRIKAVGADVKAPAGVRVIDGTGDTLLPGLIDAHTHSWGDALKEALIFGVTTELDMFTDVKYAAQIRTEQAANKDLDLADLRSARTLVTAPGGHGTEYGIPIPTISKPEEAQAFVDARIAEGSDYIKIISDDGSTYGRTMPTVTKETIAAIVVAAHKRGKLVTVHVGTQQEAREAIEAGADGLAHLFVDSAPAPDFGKFAAAHHVFVTPTLTVLDAICCESSGKDLPKDARLAPYFTPAEIGALQVSFGLHKANLKLENAEETIRQLKAAGVPILAGTDSPNPGTVHGASMHREMEMLVHAGLTPLEALVAATSAPAKAFHLDDRGEIAPGKRADLLLVRGDPTTDITATRDIVSVWKLGVEDDRASYRAARDKDRADAEAAAKNGGPPAGAESGLISDFEDGTTKVMFGTGWVVSSDTYVGGKSTAEMKVVEGGANGSKYSLQITGEIALIGTFQWAGASFTAGVAPTWAANLSSKKTIHFWARGDGRTYVVMVFAKSFGGRTPGSQTFVAGPEWKEYRMPLTAFGTDGHDIGGILFSGSAPAGKFSFQIDDVKVD